MLFLRLVEGFGERTDEEVLEAVESLRADLDPASTERLADFTRLVVDREV